jgi:potassium-transporting ATPase KdpC subunit
MIMTQILRPAISLVVLFTLVLGLGYPLAMTGIAQAVFASRADGSPILADGKIIGSELIGQNFAADRYFWPRPSATSDQPYNAGASTGTNLGPTSAKLKDMVETEVARLRTSGLNRELPADAATYSGSGLDPDISPAFAMAQIARVARAKGLPETDLTRLVESQTRGRTLGLFGEPRVNVLVLNMALDAVKAD